jgi:transcriptional regulator with XRE-family HTH domain
MDSIEISKNSLKHLVSHDIKKYLKKYNNEKIGRRLLSEKSDINERTLNRLESCENKPTYRTLIKLYKAMFNVESEADLLKICPELVSKEIKKFKPSGDTQVFDFSSEIETQMYYDNVLSEIYILACCGPISRSFVQFKFGVHGIEKLEKMTELKMLKTTNGESYNVGNLPLNPSEKILKRWGQNLSEKYLKTDNSMVKGTNVVGFFAEGLSEKTYNAWLKIDEDAFNKKIELTKQEGALGAVKAFTYMVTDTLTESKK